MEKEWAGQNLALGGEICVSIHTRLSAVRADTSNTSNTNFTSINGNTSTKIFKIMCNIVL